MKSYWIDATFPLEDGSLGDLGFPVKAENIFEAAKTATEVVEDLVDKLDLTIWSITEEESE